MKVLSAEFVTSAAAAAPAGIPHGAAQIALVGRSNVGKSTLINALCRTKIARTSAAPGKTRLANFYRVRLEIGNGQRELYLVDLPGYGYARGGPVSARELQSVAEAYFRSSLFATLLLIDSRHPALQADLAARAWVASMGVAPHIVATKIDKLSRSERARNLKTLVDTFGTAAIPVSAQSGEGLNELWQLIIRLAKNT